MEKLSLIFTKQTSLPTKILVVIMSAICLLLFLFVIVRNASAKILSIKTKPIESKAKVIDKKFIPSPFSVRGYQVNEDSLAKDNIFLVDFAINEDIVTCKCKKEQFDKIEKEQTGTVKYKSLGRFGNSLVDFNKD